MIRLFILISIMSIGSSLHAQKKSFPYELNLKKELMIASIGLGSISLNKLGDSSKEKLDIIKIDNLNKNEINGFDRRTINNWDTKKNDIRESFEPLVCIASTTGAVLAGIKQKEKNNNLNILITLGTMYAEGLLITYGIKQCSKTYINRYRPYMYNPSVPLEVKLKPEGNESFFSGNTAIMFYNTTFLSKIYSDLYPNKNFKYIIMGLGFGWSAYSGWLSVKSGKHFMSDVITGALFGCITGYLIPHLHLKKNSKKKYKLSISPTLLNGNNAGLAIALKL